MIQIDAVSKAYEKGKVNEHLVLDEVSLHVSAGEMVAIMGKSGSGKSTLLHILGLLDSYDKGTYFLDGVNVQTLSNAKRAQLRNSKIGYVVQDFALIEEDSVKNNIALPLLFSKKNSSRKKTVEEVLQLVDLEGYERRKVKLLSGGEKQRVAIGRAVINDPDVIMADEPTGNLDQKTGNHIIKLFRELNKVGKTVLIITHDEEVAGQCDRIIDIADGKIRDRS